MSSESIPDIGLGTWQNTYSRECVDSVATALELGYRHVDTAQAYGNERHVGEGIQRSSVDRDDVFLASKVWIENLSPDDVVESTHASLDRLDTGYVDLMYVHWPSGDYSPEETLAAFDELVDRGLAEHVGISNFPPARVREAREILDAEVMANQVEMHPLLQQDELLEFLRERDVELVAYSPLARGRVDEVDVLREIADHYDATPFQVSLAWLAGKDGVHPIPKSCRESHIRENYHALDLELSDEDVREIESIDRRKRFVEPDFSPEWGRR